MSVTVSLDGTDRDVSTSLVPGTGDDTTASEGVYIYKHLVYKTV